MREIKFRAWDKNDHDWYKNPEIKRMTYYSNPVVFDDGFIQLDVDGQPAIGDMPVGGRHILMQFTGLLDKNGKEIYEGDIVTSNILIDQQVNGLVYYVAPGFEVVDTDKKWLESLDESCQVIGNIYENPELMKG